MGFNTAIYLANIATSQDSSTGKRSLNIVSKTLVYADVQEVGMNEFYSAQSNKVELVAVFEIPAHMYNQERYLLIGNIQYRIYRAGKGRSLGYIKLPCIKCPKKDLVEGYNDS